MSRYVQAALSSVDYEDHVRNESEIKEKMASIKKELKVMKISEQITDKVPQKPFCLNELSWIIILVDPQPAEIR